MKYIMIQRTLSSSMDEDNVTMYPIIFPKELVYKDIAEAIAKVISNYWGDSEIQVVSAGEINLVAGYVHGFSDTLKLNSDPADDSVISMVDYFNVHRYRIPTTIINNEKGK